MALEDREQTDLLAPELTELEKAPHGFGFFHALRLIECLHADAPRLGTSRRPSDDPLRLGQEAAMRFESSSLVKFEPHRDGGPHRLTVRLLGLLGPNGPLPLHLTEYAQERLQRHKDRTFIQFLDIFHHRMLALFYRAWANSEPTVSLDRAGSDWMANYVGALTGLGMPALRGRQEVSDWTKFYYCGHLACQARYPEGLRGLLNEYFKLPAAIDEFVGEWLPLPKRDLFRPGLNCAGGSLGVSIVIGTEVWSSQHRFRVLLGPLGFDEYESFLPGGARIRRLCELVRAYVGDELAWDLKLILKRREVPRLSLDGRLRMGWTTWLGKRTVEEDAGDLILDVSANINLNRRGTLK